MAKDVRLSCTVPSAGDTGDDHGKHESPQGSPYLGGEYRHAEPPHQTLTTTTSADMGLDLRESRLAADPSGDHGSFQRRPAVTAEGDPCGDDGRGRRGRTDRLNNETVAAEMDSATDNLDAQAMLAERAPIARSVRRGGRETCEEECIRDGVISTAPSEVPTITLPPPRETEEQCLVRISQGGLSHELKRSVLKRSPEKGRLHLGAPHVHVRSDKGQMRDH